jgi:hypothetical protein
VIVGGGDSALDWAINLQDTASGPIRVVHRRERFRALESSQTAVRQLVEDGAAVLHTPCEVRALNGGDVLERVTIEDTATGEAVDVECEALILQLGFVSHLGPIESWGLEVVGKKQVRVDPTSFETALRMSSRPAAGLLRQITPITTGLARQAIAANQRRGRAASSCSPPIPPNSPRRALDGLGCLPRTGFKVVRVRVSNRLRSAGRALMLRLMTVAARPADLRRPGSLMEPSDPGASRNGSRSDMDGGLSRGMRRRAGWLGVGLCWARLSWRREGGGRDCMVSLIFEGWVPHDHRFVAGSSRSGRGRWGGCPESRREPLCALRESSVCAAATSAGWGQAWRAQQ